MIKWTYALSYTHYPHGFTILAGESYDGTKERVFCEVVMKINYFLKNWKKGLTLLISKTGI